jgi:hypothetical protein
MRATFSPRKEFSPRREMRFLADENFPRAAADALANAATTSPGFAPAIRAWPTRRFLPGPHAKIASA